MGYELKNIEQCYLPWANVICLGKWQITCTATKNPISSPPALFLYSSSHNWVRKCLGSYPLLIKCLYRWQGTMYVCYIFIFYIHHFLLTEQMWQPSKDVSLIIKGKMVSGKFQCLFEETCPRVITIFQTVHRYALSFVRCQACQVWIMGGVVLQALWCQCLVTSEPASTIFMWAQIYYNRVRNNFGIVGHCISFLYIFYYFITCSLSDCYKCCQRLTNRMWKVFLPRGSYQVRLELELEFKSRWSNCRETIQLQLMCCTP